MPRHSWLLAGEGELQEQFLFHGSDLATLGTIMLEGFDSRVSNTNGALGSGVYFAWSSHYSQSYSAKARTLRTADVTVTDIFVVRGIAAARRVTSPSCGSELYPCILPGIRAKFVWTSRY